MGNTLKRGFIGHLKKVLFLIHDLGGGGAEKVLVNLVNHLDRNMFDITVVALFGHGVNEPDIASHIHFHSVFSRTIRGNSKIMKLFSPRLLHRLFIKNKYDIEVSYLEGPCARIISGCVSPDTKLVSWIHGEQHTKSKASGAFRSYSESRECYKRFDRIVCVSETVKEDFSSIYPEVRQLFVCYNTMNFDHIRKLMDEPVDSDLFHSNEFNLIAVGKIIPPKGFDRLAKIVKQLREDNLPVHLYALGTGDQQKQIEAYLRANGIQEAYTFLGYKINPYKYIARSDLFVCASWAEGFSTAALESLIVGTPVCTVEVSGMREMLGQNNEYGIVTKNDDEALYTAIKSLICNPEKILKYKKQSSVRGAMFQTEKTVQMAQSLLLTL